MTRKQRAAYSGFSQLYYACQRKDNQAIPMGADGDYIIEGCIDSAIRAYEAAKAKDQPDHCREAFERLASSKGCKCSQVDGVYVHENTRWAWLGWKARPVRESSALTEQERREAVQVMASKVCEAEWKRACEKHGVEYARSKPKPSALRDAAIALSALLESFDIRRKP